MLGMIKKYCVVTGGGQEQNFDLLGDEQASLKSQKASRGGAKGGGGKPGRLSRHARCTDACPTGGLAPFLNLPHERAAS